MSYKILLGNNLDVLPTLPDNSVDSIVTDPPYELGFMGKKWDSSGIAYNVELWRECLRVLKPGGHLLSFGGTRTYHRVAVAIEDAGFELRDSIAWLYGSGFPKSLDVSKAIDKGAGAEREVLGRNPNSREQATKENTLYESGTVGKTAFDTAPSTPKAQQWQGWGTALKPAFEPVIVARKPLGGEIAVRTIIENELNKLGFSKITWTKAVKPAIKSNQKQTSGSTSQPKTAETSAKTVNAKEMLDTEQTTQTLIGQPTSGSGTIIQAEQTSLLASQINDSNSKSLKPMDLIANAVENQTEPSLPLTTSTAVEMNTGKEHLAKSGTNLDGLDSPVVIESFAGIATGLIGSLATVLINRLDNGTFEWPANLPEVEKVGTTVANNVLKWGTGGLNIDGSRIGTESITINTFDNGAKPWGDAVGEPYTSKQSTGRWPANIILDPYTAELLDEQSGISKGQIGMKRISGGKQIFDTGGRSDTQSFQTGVSDEGGASRFFYVAKASKRDRNEGLEELEAKQAVGGGGGIGDYLDDVNSASGKFGSEKAPAKNFHPTVKPTSLMEYLIKLVTPPKGTVLDPFTGSGSTGKAAILQGFDFIGIEMTEDYLPIIEGRLKHAEQLVAEAKEQEKLKETEKLF